MKAAMGLVLAGVLFSMGSWSSSPENTPVQPVYFDMGMPDVTLNGVVKGDHFIDYGLRGKTGQTLRVKLKTDNSSNYFNVLPPDNRGQALFIGSIEGNEWTGSLAADGIYTIRIYLMRNAARRGEQAAFALTISGTNPEK